MGWSSALMFANTGSVNNRKRYDRILILDFGGQYAQLIARRVRELGVYCELHGSDLHADAIADFAPHGVILSGGPGSVTEVRNPIPEGVLSLGVPVLGICYGLQALAAGLGGKVSSSSRREYGLTKVRARGRSRLLAGIEDFRTTQGHGMLEVWMSHGDRVDDLPPGFRCIASSEHAPLAGMADEQRAIYALQFHPEVTHTPQGQSILKRFVYDICGCKADWTPRNIVADAITQVRTAVGTQRVLLGLSGGVDSAVVARLLSRAIGRQLVCVFVDTGLLRLHEGDQVMRAFDDFELEMIRIDAAAEFMQALAGVVDPEQKRKVIGAKFVEIFEREAAKINQVQWLAQGTIYPDVIESAGANSANAQVIKSHHNVGGLPERMGLKLLEPLRELFKDEVRMLGVQLGLPASLVQRHPFPGPGLAVRILGEVSMKQADLLRQADAIFIEELRRCQLYDQVAQAFAVLLPVNSVGVMGDERRYEPVIALRAVTTTDFMTADWARLPAELLDTCARRIVNEVAGVSRVVYDISGKPPATIEWE